MAGMHLPMNVILQVQSNSVGALLGLFIISNNAKTKSDAISAAIPGVFGVTEPGIYGVTLPRVKPFIAACLGSGVGGIFIGVLGVQSRVMSGLGVFSYIGMFSDPVMPELAPDNMLSNSTNGSLFILCTMIAMFSAIAFTMLLHTERIKEKNIIKKLNRQLVKLILNENKDKNKYIELKNEFSKIDFELSKEEKNLLKKIEKNILAISNLEEQHSRIINKDNKAKDKMLIEGQKALKNGDSEKTYKIYLKHKQDNSENKKKDILEKINKLKNQMRSDSLQHLGNPASITPNLDEVVKNNEDHGDYTGDFGISEKVQNCFDDPVVKVPLLFKPAKQFKLKSGIIDTPVELVDIPATLADIAGINLSYTQYGKSLIKRISGEEPYNEYVYSEGGRIHGEVQAMEIGHGEESEY
ncbi:hypothetical protein FQR65_LT16450 [Abscondita terminalis]|nr:hypothetical protein FQR65_LT16450 [Abscondita terminalis]